MEYERKYAWSPLLRFYHWAFALSIVFLSVSGFFIHFPWSNTNLEGSQTYYMSEWRYIHFSAGFVFMCALVARIYLLIFGNKQEKLLDFIPVTPKNIVNFFKTIMYYGYIKDKTEHRTGHNTFAGLFYVVVFILAILQCLSGLFLLYPEGSLWTGIGYSIFSAQQDARHVHYLIMWGFFVFILSHIYIVIWNDIKEPEGLISSMFNGYKFFEKER
jgi:Ni/Fe-hydrogenase 1 B-type cytochrome subunit